MNVYVSISMVCQQSMYSKILNTCQGRWEMISQYSFNLCIFYYEWEIFCS
jgi:hypothetical protein